MEERIKITVVVPVLDEEKNIMPTVKNILKAFKDYDIKGEIIIVNDGSTDRTNELAIDIAKKEKCIGIVSHPVPQGIGASFWNGVDHANGDIVVMIPGDNENDPWEILRYHELLNHVDIVIPFIFNREARPLFRNALSFLYRFIVNTTFMVNFNYTNGTVLYRKSILKELDYRSSSFFFQTDILIRTVKRGYLFAEVPCKLGSRKSGISKAVSFPSLIQVVKGYLHLVREFYGRSSKITKTCFQHDSSTADRRT